MPFYGPRRSADSLPPSTVTPLSLALADSEKKASSDELKGHYSPSDKFHPPLATGKEKATAGVGTNPFSSSQASPASSVNADSTNGLSTAGNSTVATPMIVHSIAEQQLSYLRPHGSLSAMLDGDVAVHIDNNTASGGTRYTSSLRNRHLGSGTLPHPRDNNNNSITNSGLLLDKTKQSPETEGYGILSSSSAFTSPHPPDVPRCAPVGDRGGNSSEKPISTSGLANEANVIALSSNSNPRGQRPPSESPSCASGQEPQSLPSTTVSGARTPIGQVTHSQFGALPTPPPAVGPSPAQNPNMATVRGMIETLLVPPNARRQQKSILLREDDIKKILLIVREVFMSQPMLLEVSAPVKICGDIHGQYYDLLKIFDKCGYPTSAEEAVSGKATSYLFLGDYVDRGKHSIETIMLLFCYKILYPTSVWLLRGNHECAAVTKNYGFMDDVKRKYNIRLWKAFTDVFNTMPCCAVISEKIICMHGGLSPDLTDVQFVNRIERPCDVPDRGVLCDLLWSDPDTDGNSGFLPSARGVGYTFGEDIVSDFLDMVDMDLIVRAHEVMERGYGFFAERQLVTIFSAPNYCGEFDNDGAVMVVDEKLQCSFSIIRAND